MAARVIAVVGAVQEKTEDGQRKEYHREKGAGAVVFEVPRRVSDGGLGEVPDLHFKRLSECGGSAWRGTDGKADEEGVNKSKRKNGKETQQNKRKCKKEAGKEVGLR